MMKHEFEEIAGYEVETKTYNEVIEPMYMATNLSKHDFAKLLDKKAFALPTKREMLNEMKREAKHLFEICGHYDDFEAKQRLDRMAKKYARRFWGIDWSRETDTYVFINSGYEYEELQRGCTYPKEVVIGRVVNGFMVDYERIMLVK